MPPTYTAAADVAAMGSEQPRVPGRAWRMLALGVTAQATGTLVVSTPVYVIPLLHLDRGVPLDRAGMLAAAPTVGMVLTLVAWGSLADRCGERWTIAVGLLLTTGFALLAAACAGDLVLLGLSLGLTGAAAASTNAASGRVVVGWFPRHRRGLAMGLRQMSQPLGVAVAAVLVPPLARTSGVAAPLTVGAVALAAVAAACAVGIVDPPRPGSTKDTAAPRPNPYRRDGFLARIHVVSMLLVVPQFTVATFGMLYLISVLGWSEPVAGGIVGLSQVVGAVGRIAVGALSDRIGSRVRVLRWVAVSAVAVMLLLAATGAARWGLAGAVALVVAATVSVADNGLAFTAVAEGAGAAWIGRALGVQNTGQFLVASAVGPVVGAMIAAVGYPLAFAGVAAAPLLARGLVPAGDLHAD